MRMMITDYDAQYEGIIWNMWSAFLLVDLPGLLQQHS